MSSRARSSKSASTEIKGGPRENREHSGLQIQLGREYILPLGDWQTMCSTSRCFCRLRIGSDRPKSGCQR